MIFSLDQRLLAARKYVLAVGVCLLACVTPLCAQQDHQLTRPGVEGKVIFGSALFGEDLEHKLVGGAVRVYVTKRLSIEPEYLYLRRSKDDQDHLGQISVAYDFADPTKRLVPYVIGGAGVLHNRGRVFGSDFATGTPFVREITFNTWTVSAGGGVKIFLTKRLFVSPELRLGREPTVRATINVGYVFGGRR
ncbi:MAG TPA: outer membrane beta-barrel protein [Pyrinomonadaceae bacterium]|nr:outer membrane beta-barrel protein [Pyrinomonadaceae bacterium]